MMRTLKQALREPRVCCNAATVNDRDKPPAGKEASRWEGIGQWRNRRASVAADAIGVAAGAARVTVGATGVTVGAAGVTASTKGGAPRAVGFRVFRNGCAAQKDDRAGTDRGKIPSHMDALCK
jgi:hypothetical protein